MGFILRCCFFTGFFPVPLAACAFFFIVLTFRPLDVTECL